MADWYYIVCLPISLLLWLKQDGECGAASKYIFPCSCLLAKLELKKVEGQPSFHALQLAFWWCWKMKAYLHMCGGWILEGELHVSSSCIKHSCHQHLNSLRGYSLEGVEAFPPLSSIGVFLYVFWVPRGANFICCTSMGSRWTFWVFHWRKILCHAWGDSFGIWCASSW